MQDERG
jgi:hypothetical protein